METAANTAATSIVIPAFNEGVSIGSLVQELRSMARWHDVLVVDDGSSDDTAARATAAGARVIRHPYNKGNGAAVKTGIRQSTAEFVLIIDADGQHQPADAVRLVAHLGTYDLVVGSRSPETQASAGRRAGNAALNRMASYLAEQPIPDLTSGLRAARRECLLEFLHLLPNGFSTPTTTTLAFMKAGYSVRFEPIEARRRSGSSHIRFASDGVGFVLILFKVITIYSPMRIFLPVGAAAFLAGVAYAVWTVLTQSHVTNSSVLLIVLSVVIFLVGLVSEQISSMRFEGRGPVTALRALVIVPTYNERENLPTLAEGLLRHENVRILIVDDQSPDGTGAIADDLACLHPGRIEVMHRVDRRGLGRSYIDGIKRAIQEPVDVVCQMDADLSHDPQHLPDLIAATSGADVVIGSRYVPGGAIVNWPARRRLLSRLANTYIRLITGLRPRDCTSGYRCWRRDALARLPIDRFFSDGYSFLIEMLFVTADQGSRIGEVPITFVERRLGHSKLSRGILVESAMTPWRLAATRGRTS